MKYIYKGIAIWVDDNYVEPIEEVSEHNKEEFCKVLKKRGWELISDKKEIVIKGEDNIVVVLYEISEVK